MSRKKGVNPRSKGKRLEYELRDTFTEWWGVPFSRTPNSGAFGTVNNRSDLVGDIYCDDESFPWSVEAKNVEGWTLEGLLKDAKCPIWKFYNQACNQAMTSKKTPLLCFSKARHPVYCITPIDALPSDFKGTRFVFESPDVPGIGRDTAFYIFLLRDLVKCDINAFKDKVLHNWNPSFIRFM